MAVAGTGLPVTGAWGGGHFHIAGTPSPIDPGSRPHAEFQAVTPGYFEAVGIRLLRGRSFSEQDTASSVPVAMVNESFVRHYLANADTLTQRILSEKFVPGSQAQGPLEEWQIVGVFRDVNNDGLRSQDYPEDVPFWQSPSPQAEMAVRTASDPSALTRTVEDVAASVEPDLPLSQCQDQKQIVESRLAGDRFSTVLYGSFGGLAVLLSAVGIYGVLAFAVAQRTLEIGLRLALGAGRGQVLRMILGEGVASALLGLGLGAVGACLVGRALKSMLYGVAAIDPAVFCRRCVHAAGVSGLSVLPSCAESFPGRSDGCAAL